MALGNVIDDRIDLPIGTQQPQLQAWRGGVNGKGHWLGHAGGPLIRPAGTCSHKGRRG
ncbi:hypothetical protein D3C87_2095620 [compost metagenome]